MVFILRWQLVTDAAVERYLGAVLLLIQLILEDVNFILLLRQSFVHCCQVLAHHTQLSFVAASRRLQLVLSHTMSTARFSLSASASAQQTLLQRRHMRYTEYTLKIKVRRNRK